MHNESFSSRILIKFEISRQEFRKTLKYKILLKSCPVGAELFYADGETDG
jgi:hypothetical protein